VADVKRVAKAYLKPENLTVAIYGKITDEDRTALKAAFGSVTVWPREEVFRGGFDAEPAAAKPSGGRE